MLFLLGLFWATVLESRRLLTAASRIHEAPPKCPPVSSNSPTLLEHRILQLRIPPLQTRRSAPRLWTLGWGWMLDLEGDGRSFPGWGDSKQTKNTGVQSTFAGPELLGSWIRCSWPCYYVYSRRLKMDDSKKHSRHVKAPSTTCSGKLLKGLPMRFTYFAKLGHHRPAGISFAPGCLRGKSFQSRTMQKSK